MPEPTSPIVAIADAVVALLNADGAFVPPLEAVRAYRPVYRLPEIDARRVTVTAVGQSIERVASSAWATVVRVEIALQQRVDADDAATLDPLLDLADAIVRRLQGAIALPGVPGAIAVSIEHLPYSAAQLEERNLFTSLIRAAYRVVR